ncbi:MAG: phospholipase D-like domain-containing protein, partial [Methyloceanibacter sp.]
YQIRHETGASVPQLETFHAKIVLADCVAAYVGSANFLYRSREANLECGFLLEGDAVAPVAVLVEAVLRAVGCADATD